MADSLLKTHSDLAFLGDMNCCPSKSTLIQDLCDIYGLTNLITEPTCHRGDVPTLLDVILVTSSQRYLGILNSECNISDFHNIIGAATRRFAPSLKPQRIMYRSYKSFNDADFLFDLQCAPFHVMNIFDDAGDMAWYTSALLSDIVDNHAPVISKFVKKNSQYIIWILSYAKPFTVKIWLEINFGHLEKNLGRKSASAKSCGVAEEKIHCEIFWKQLL